MITLLMPTMNRSDFLIRLLGYYSDLGFQGCICIGDSSNSAHLDRTKAAISAFQGTLNIVYREYPHLSAHLCEQQLLQFVTTPYIALAPDDDFLVPSALKRCEQFLDEHPDYIAAHGVAALISLEWSESHRHVTGAGPYKQPVIEGGSASQRLVDHLGNYSTSPFSVHRVEAWRVMGRDISLVPDRAFGGELLRNCLSVIQGKVKELDCLYLVRQAHDRRYVLPDVYDWVTSPHWLPSYQVFRDRVAEELARQDGISMEAARDVVKHAFWSYLSRALTKKWKERYARSSQSLLPQARSIPAFRRTWREVRSFLPGERNRFSLPALLRPTSPYHEEFMPIYRAITTPPSDPLDRGAVDSESSEPWTAKVSHARHTND